ncbi:UNVERIFIED_CONTAM: hypothetical protein HDU68_006726 [Siphonaria sp. JEL0065]|nr:hypothetical protein HDU68_006726 [Siphonaria sp. JEL0065]
MGKDRHKAQKGSKAKKHKDPTPYISHGSRGGTFFSPTHEHLLSMLGSGGPVIPQLSTSGPPQKSAGSTMPAVPAEPKVKNIRKNKKGNMEPQRPILSSASQSGLLHQALLSTSSPHLRTLTRFKKTHGILLVGEGDFSFTSALCRALDITTQSVPSKADGRVIATSYDTLSDISSKYTTDAVDRIRLLQRLPNVSVIHKLDATTMSQDGRLVSTENSTTFKPIHRIVFNFPHVGGGMDKDVKVNRRMLLAFFKEAQILLSLSHDNSLLNAGNGDGNKKKLVSGSNSNIAMSDFQVLVSLRKTPFYEKFGLQELAEASGFKLTERTRFDGERWSALGYKPQRTNPAQREAPGWENAELFVFALDSETGFEQQDVDGLESDEELEEEDEELEEKKGRRKRGERALPAPIKKGSRADRVQQKFKRRQEKKDLKKQKLGKVKGGKISKKGNGGWETL